MSHETHLLSLDLWWINCKKSYHPLALPVFQTLGIHPCGTFHQETSLAWDGLVAGFSLKKKAAEMNVCSLQGTSPRD